MTIAEYKAQYKFPEDIRACFVTREDWPAIVAWMRDNRLVGVAAPNARVTEDSLFGGDSGAERFNCLFLDTDGRVRKWDNNAQDAERMEARIRSQQVEFACYHGDKDIILSASLFRSPRIPPPDLEF